MSAATQQRRGRPRVEGLDQALLDVTLELAGEVGIHGMSMDDLAQRAGVSKATIYRRWPSKERLVLESLNQAMRPFDLIDTGRFAAISTTTSVNWRSGWRRARRATCSRT